MKFLNFWLKADAGYQLLAKNSDFSLARGRGEGLHPRIKMHPDLKT
jgi:hypothetical protein